MLLKELVKVDTVLKAGQAEGLAAIRRFALQSGQSRFRAFAAGGHWIEIAGRCLPLAKLDLDPLGMQRRMDITAISTNPEVALNADKAVQTVRRVFDT